MIDPRIGEAVLPDEDDLANAKPIAVRTWLIVYQWPAEERTKAGLVLPDTAQSKPQIGTVISKGPQVTTEVDEDQVVCFPDYAGAYLEFTDKRKFLILAQEDIYCRLEGVAPLYPEPPEPVDSVDERPLVEGWHGKIPLFKR